METLILPELSEEAIAQELEQLKLPKNLVRFLDDFVYWQDASASSNFVVGKPLAT